MHGMHRVCRARMPWMLLEQAHHGFRLSLDAVV